MKVIETENYIIRHVQEEDFEDIKKLLLENEYLKMLWDIALMPEDRLNAFLHKLYMDVDGSYGVCDKETGRLCGHLSIMQDEREGELSVRMRKIVDTREIMQMFGEILRDKYPAEQKNFTIQYCFE